MKTDTLDNNRNNFLNGYEGGDGVTKQTFKYYLVLIILGILSYQIIQQPQFIYTFIKFVSSLLTPFWIGFFLAIILNPIVKRLQKHLRFSRGLGILLTYLGLVIVVATCAIIIIPSVIGGINDLFTEMTGYFERPEQWFSSWTLEGPYVEEIKLFIQDNINHIVQSVMAFINSLSSSILTSIINLTSHLFNLIFGVTISIYLIMDQEKVMNSFRKGLYVYFPKQAKQVNYYVRFSYHMFQDYIVGRLLDSMIIGLLAYVGFVLLKAPYVWLFAFIIFITNIIPYFGPIIGAIIPILMTFIVNPVQAIWIAIFILFLQQLDGNLIGPKIMGDRVGLSPLWVISSVIIGGALCGFIGFFLAVPVAAVIKEFYDQRTQLRLEEMSDIMKKEIL